jgi:glycosyltransferase involved in cell wall biosynthesis
VPNTVLMVSQPGEAGVAHVLADHVSWVTAAGWNVVVACDPGSRCADLVRRQGGRVMAWRAERHPGVSVASEVRALRRIISETDPDLVHLHSSKAGLVGRIAIRGRLPTLFQPHAWSFDASAPKTLSKLALNWEQHAARWTDITICVSAAERERGSRAGIRGTTVVLPNVVDAERFRPPPHGSPWRLAMRKRLGLTTDGPLAVCLGRLCRQKGQDLLLASWNQVKDMVPDAQLALVGDGPDRNQLALSAPSGVRFVGAVLDPVPWLQLADVVVVPSRWEGQALVILEALACGTAVVASDIPANKETMPSAAGAVVPVVDRTALASALIRRLVPEGRALTEAEGRVGRASVVTGHDPAAGARALTQLYARSLSREGGFSHPHRQ